VGSDRHTYSAASPVTGLVAGTVYHYRLVATSPTGEAIGTDRTFMTVPNAPEIVGTSSSDLTVGAVTLNAQVATGHGSTVVYFQYGPTTEYTSSTIAGEALPADDATHSVNSRVSGLAPSSTYHFRAVAVNFASVAYGPDETVTTPGIPGVTSGAATDITRTSASISGTVTASLAPTTYHFEYGRGASSEVSTSESSPLSPDAVNQSVGTSLGGLQPGTTYHYRLVATNGLGSIATAERSFTTVAPEAVPGPEPEKIRKCRRGKVRRHGRCVKRHHKHHRKRHRRRHRSEGR
jgi:phosphodiesterase/alkaline phosphatase D-like protein